jgi:hypothetical protein
MTRKTRQVLLALTVTTALCADQVAVAAPTLRPQVAELAGQIVTRLSRTFRQSVTIELPEHTRGRDAQPVRTVVSVAASQDDARHQPISPFQFRLPPPAL